MPQLPQVLGYRARRGNTYHLKPICGRAKDMNAIYDLSGLKLCKKCEGSLQKQQSNNAPAPDAVVAPVADEPQDQPARLVYWQQYFWDNWLRGAGRKDTPPAVPVFAKTKVDKPMRHSEWVEACATFYTAALEKLGDKTRSDQIHRGKVLGEELARLLLPESPGGPTRKVHFVLMDGVGRILFETLRVAREILTVELAGGADELLNTNLSVTIYDIKRKMNDCHRHLMPNVTVAEANIIPGKRSAENGPADHLKGVDVVYFNFSSLGMCGNGIRKTDFVRGGYGKNFQSELSATSQRERLRECILALPDNTKVMVSVFTARTAADLKTDLPPNNFFLDRVAPEDDAETRRDFETAWVTKVLCNNPR